MTNKAEITIISSLDKKNEFHYIKYFIKCLFFNIKILYYLFNINKKTKYLNIFHHYTLTKGCEIAGHHNLALSLFRGLRKLNIPYLHNKITKNTKYVILLWADANDLKKVECYRKKYKIKTVVTVPTACKYDYDYMQWHFPQESCIDFSLYASQWVANVAKDKNNEKFYKKIVVWPSGVEFNETFKKGNETKSIILYFKRLNINYELVEKIRALGIECKIFEYTKYEFNDYLNQLISSDLVVFYQDYHETQGLAMAEAWSFGCPILVKTYVKNSLESPSPYLTETNGEYFISDNELLEILKKYVNNPKEFLLKYNSRKYVKEEMSDEVSVKKLLHILKDGNNE